MAPPDSPGRGSNLLSLTVRRGLWIDNRRALHGAARLADSGRVTLTPQGDAMDTFMVERSLKGISMGDLGAAQKAAIGTAADMSKNGTPISYIRSTFVPETGACMCLFKADSAASVK